MRHQEDLLGLVFEIPLRDAEVPQASPHEVEVALEEGFEGHGRGSPVFRSFPHAADNANERCVHTAIALDLGSFQSRPIDSGKLRKFVANTDRQPPSDGRGLMQEVGRRALGGFEDVSDEDDLRLR